MAFGPDLALSLTCCTYMKCKFSSSEMVHYIQTGSWEIETYGLFGMYKSDWMTIGGFDVEKYTNKWGGEDWDILDKLVGAECAGGVPTNTMSSCAG